jgi:hypothetical protein
MRKICFFLAFVALVLSSCNNNWDDYYFGSSVAEQELSMSIKEFLDERPEYSDFYTMLKTTGLDKELTKDQQITIWVVKNENMALAGIAPNDTLRMKYHINILPFIRSDLKNGLRIRSLNGIYFQIKNSKDTLLVNNSNVIKSFRLNNGVVHEIDNLMKSRINMYDYIKQLDNNYSMIRDSIFKYNKELFDKANSTPIGVDKTGNTIYDSVFYVYNPLFQTVPFNSEFKQFTVFVPSNTVITNCLDALNTQYKKMGKTVTLNDTILAFKWIKEAMFYNGILKNTDLSTTDIKSAFNRVWRTTVQLLDINNPVDLSNGILYKTTKVKIPNNVIITRIKSLVEYWQYQEKIYPDPADLYKFTGMKEGTTPSTFVDSETPKPSVLPNYITLNISGNSESENEFSMEFPPLEKYTEEGKTKVRVMEVPTGEYNLYMGFHSQGHPYINIYFNNVLISKNIQASLSTPWNFDRVNETDKDLNPVGGISKWDGLGGLVGTVNIDGEGLASFRIKVEFNKLDAIGATKSLRVYHWTLKPTANNY